MIYVVYVVEEDGFWRWLSIYPILLTYFLPYEGWKWMGQILYRPFSFYIIMILFLTIFEFS